MSIVNLQNTATPPSVTVETVTFKSGSEALRGLLFKPSTVSGRLPAVIVTGAWTTVKEQMAGTYARELANNGIAALSFDFSGWGESSGEVRYVEDPETKTADIHSAVAYLSSRDEIDSNLIGGVGVCASSGYMAKAVAENPNLKTLCLVAPWLHTSEIAEQVYGGPDLVKKLIADSETLDPNEAVVTAASTQDENAPMYGAPYYTESDPGLIDAYDNKFNLKTWKPWLTYNSHESAKKLNKPTLFVQSPSIALPAGADAYASEMADAPDYCTFPEGISQFDFYDDSVVISKAVEAIKDHLLTAV